MGRLIAWSVWLLAIGQILLAPPHWHDTGVTGLPTAVLFMPILFFGLGAFFVPAYPFDVAFIRRWVDGRHGSGTYAAFMRELKPILLFASTAIASGVLRFFGSLRFDAPPAYRESGMAVSAGLGFLALRWVLRKRGLLMESGAPGGAWAERKFLPRVLQNLRATWRTAFLAGIWTASGFMTLDAFKPAMDPTTYDNASLACAVPFFFVPMLFFVFGIQDLSRQEFSWEGLRRQGQVFGRMIAWVFGGALVFSVLGSLRRLFG